MTDPDSIYFKVLKRYWHVRSAEHFWSFEPKAFLTLQGSDEIFKRKREIKNIVVLYSGLTQVSFVHRCYVWACGVYRALRL